MTQLEGARMLGEQNVMMWCVGQELVMFHRKPFVSDRLVVSRTGIGGQPPTVDLKIATKGEWDVPLARATYKFKRTRGFLGEKFELRSPNGELVPHVAKPIAALPVPAESKCAKHGALATVVCARCGSFSCPECAGVDLLHCRACLVIALDEQQRNARAAAFLVPAAAFMYLGGLLGAVLGVLAGAGAMAFAKRSENQALKILVAVGLYSVAAVVWVVLASMIERQ